MHLVFVYGTLKRGYPYGHVLQDEQLIGPTRSIVPRPLVIGGRWFSPVLVDEPGAGHRVEGELYSVDDGTLALLDEMEGVHHDIGYDRIEIEVEVLDDGATRSAYAYVKPWDRVDVVHTPEPLTVYEPDPRYVPADRRTDTFGSP